MRRSIQHLALVTSAVAALSGAGCRQDMHNQPKARPMRASDVFTDGRSARPFVEGTVARGRLDEDEWLTTGKVGGTFVDRFPFPVDAKVMERGRERYEIFCAPCHDRTGTGNGLVVRRGYRRPPAFAVERLRQQPAGYFFDVVTNGFGVMPDYRTQIPIADRWAIVSYVRALQLSGHATIEEVPPSERGRLEGAGK